MTKLIVAIDTPDFDEALALFRQVKPYCHMIKIGLAFWCALGPNYVETLFARANAEQFPFMLDLKFKDTHQTVAAAVRAVRRLKPEFITVHADGGHDMMYEAMEVVKERTDRPKIIAVTVLTSMNAQDMAETGIQKSLADQVCNLAELAHQAGVDGVVCSPWEIQMIRNTWGNDFTIVVPGIAVPPMVNVQHARADTPQFARQAGADYIVVGSAITNTRDPAKAAKKIFDLLV